MTYLVFGLEGLKMYQVKYLTKVTCCLGNAATLEYAKNFLYLPKMSITCLINITGALVDTVLPLV